MKKIISIALALVMMMAICVPAFATDVTTDGANNVDVVTSYDASTDASYTVTIPATVSVEWDDTTTEYDVGYTVNSQLLIGAALKVTVAYDADADDTNNGVMTNADTTATLTYTLAGVGVGETKFAEVNDNVKTDATITVAGFDTAPIGEYTGTITYTVEYVAPVNA